MKKIASALLVALAVSLTTAPTPAVAGLADGTAAYNNKDYGKALEMLLPAAQQGDAQAQHLVGSMFLKGTGTGKSEVDAVKWFRLSARQGNVASMKALAGLLVQGKGVAQNVDEATQWFQRAEEATTRPETKAVAGGVAKANVSAAQVLASECWYPSPSIPERIYDLNIAGMVRAAVLIDDGMPKDVIIYSGPKVYHDVFRKALLQYDCSGKKFHVLAKRGYTSIGYGPKDRSLYTIEQREPPFEFGPPPFNSDWNGLGHEQKMAVRGQYANMVAEDEPPYPIEGMGELLENIRLVAERLQSPGVLRLTVKIDTSGKVEAVNLLQAADPELGKYAAEILYRTSFKPALCAKLACAMSFPIDAVVESTVLNDDAAAQKELYALRDAAQNGAPYAQHG